MASCRAAAAVHDRGRRGQVSPVKTLQAAGLTLEPLRVAHADAMFLVLCDPAIYEYEEGPPPSVEWLRQRYRRLESRRSPDGTEHWLNWIIRLPDGQVAGYVQASARLDGHCYIAYVLGSAWWGRGLARRSVEAMIAELGPEYGIHTLWAVFNKDNHRSRGLLERLGFEPAPAAEFRTRHVSPGERLMTRQIHLE
jgi:ribosomal-protein-alanine N-acetyltransferase